MNKESLIEYCDIQEEIKKLRKRIDNLENQSPTVSDVVQNGHKRRAVIYGIDEKRKYKIDILKIKLKEFEDKLLDKQLEAEDFIESIKESKTRQIFEHRYLDNMDFYQIAIQMGYSGESGPRMKHDRYLEKTL